MRSVVPADPSDLDELLPLIRELHAHEGFEAPELRRSVARLIGDANIGRLLVCREGNKPLGYAIVSFGYSLEFGGRDAFVDEIYVRPESRSQGVGAHLLSACEHAALSGGARVLHLEVDRGNPRAQELYVRSGYKEHTRHLMTKWLD